MPKLNLKLSCYANFIRRNLFLLRFDSKARNYLLYRAMPHRAWVNTRRAGPVFMTLNLTRRCNLSCRFCIVGDVLNTDGWEGHESQLADVERILSHPIAERCLYVMLTGGEPLLCRDLVPIVAELKARNHLVGVNTNGLLLAEKIDALVAAGVDMLNVSHYDANSARLADVLPEVQHRVFTKLLEVIGRQDVHEPARIHEVLALAEDSGCRKVFFQNVYPHVDHEAAEREIRHVRKKTGTETEPIMATDAGAYSQLRAEMRRRYPRVSCFWPAPVLDSITADDKRCRMPWYLISVDAGGNLALCSAHASCTGPSIFDVDPEEAFNQPRWTECRSALLEQSDRLPSDCEGCYGLNDPWRRDM